MEYLTEIIYIGFGASFLLLLDIALTRRARKKKGQSFQYSRYNMFVNSSSGLNFIVRPSEYRLPDQKPLNCSFDITVEGFQDKIIPCENLLIGGSTAFGTGATSSQTNVTGVLRKKYDIDVINLAVPGWIIEQEVITIIKYIDTISPKQIILVNGPNNLALGLPFNYHYSKIKDDPIAIYGEMDYEILVNQHYKNFRPINSALKGLAREILGGTKTLNLLKKTPFGKLTPSYGYMSHYAKAQSKAILDNRGPELIENSINNYIHWLKIIRDIVAMRKIKLLVVLQPYFSYGRPRSQFEETPFPYFNEPFNDLLSHGLEQLEAECLKLDGLRLVPAFKSFAEMPIDYFIDPVHLTHLGYDALADLIKNELQ